MNWGTVPEWLIAIGLVVLAWRMRPRRPSSGTHVMPKVNLPDGYEPPSAAVITPQPSSAHRDGLEAPDA